MEDKIARNMKVSVIIPLYNEEESIRLLYESVVRATMDYKARFEFVLVDDGSTDRTFEVAESLAKADPRLKIVKFRRNYGQTPAMTAGIDNATGDILITMDGDLQNDPRDIPLFLAQIEQGFDLVVGWRHKRQDKMITRKVPSKIANWLIGLVTGVPIKDNGCSLKAYRADVVKSIPLYSEMHRFIPAMLSLTGARIAEIKVRHHARQFGQSKYGLSRVYKVLLDLLTIKMITSFSTRLIYWFAGLAGIMFVVSVACTIIAVTGMAEAPLIFLGVSLVFGTTGLFLITCGVLGELIFRSGRFHIARLPILTTDVLH